MNKVYKLLLAGLFGFCLTFSVEAQQTTSEAVPQQAVAVEGPLTCEMDPTSMPLEEFHASKFCYDPNGQMFVVIDSIDCAIDLRIRGVDTVVGRFVTDSLYKRHDLNNILRPRSVSIVGNYIVFIAVSAKDSSYVGVLNSEPVDGKLQLVQRVGISSMSDAFGLSAAGEELIVVGTNPYGYNINIFDIADGIENISADKCQSMGYRVKKQAELIKESDPYGVGLTVVAVVVVFFALICIALILKGYGKSIIKVQNRRAKKTSLAQNADKGSMPIVSTGDTAGEVYAAIAAAIYMYDEELHDDEDGVITIQKVERAWTPWNAKYYNMNHYFNNRK